MRQYPNVYSQRDPQWANQRLGTVDGITLGGYGCIVSCHSMKCGYYGHTITPAALDDVFTNKGIYVQGDLTPDDGITKIYSDIKLLEVKDWASVAADLGYLKTLAQDPTKTVTLEIDFDHDPTDGLQTHFVELHEFDGTTLTIYDPWYGSSDNFTLHYGTNLSQTILKAVVYQGTPVASSTVSTGGATYYKGYDLTNQDSMKIAVDVLVRLQQGDLVDRADLNAICTVLGIPSGSNKDAINAAIAQLQKDKAQDEQTVTTLNQQIPALTKRAETAEGQVETLTQQLKDSSGSGIEPNSGLAYKDLYAQSNADLVACRADSSEAEKTYNRTIAQLKNSSFSVASTGDLWSELVKRVFRLK